MAPVHSSTRTAPSLYRCRRVICIQQRHHSVGEGALRRSAAEHGQTTMMVTHDATAATIADRIVFLADGRVVRTLGRSTAAEVLDALAEVTR